MKAIVIDEFGPSQVLRQTEIPKPRPGPGEILIAVHATSVNPVDWKMRSGAAAFLVPTFPAVLHPDCAGVVTEIGEGVLDFEIGDEVWSFGSGLMGKQGALAEFMPVDARMASKKPRSLSFNEAATLPLVAVTAWFCLTDRMRVSRGMKVLIQGGTGGVGSISVQIARSLGAEVFATCGSEERCQMAEWFGAEQAYDYKTVPMPDIVTDATGGRGFDVVFNTPGASSVNASVEAAGFGGTILDINGAFPTAGGFQGKQLGFLSVFAGYPIVMGFDQDKIGRFLRDTATLFDSEELTPLVDPKRFTFAEIGAAHDYQEHGNPTGKVAVSALWS